MLTEFLKTKITPQTQQNHYKSFWQSIHIDLTLLMLVLLVVGAGFIILFSASNQQTKLVQIQFFHFIVGLIALFTLAQVSPATLQRYTPLFYTFCILCLLIVLIIGHIGKGGQRWLHLGFFRFQPSELMKIAIPLMIAWFFHRTQLPIRMTHLMIAIPLILLPAFLTAKQPDLATALLLVAGGASACFLAGIRFRFLIGLGMTVIASIPFAWYFLYDYQKQRVLTFFDPERDALGKGYHIIQSKIAIGSGGLFGKGWLSGTQSSLHFLPEHTTDFIFAVAAEEFGFMGSVILLILYLLIVFRGFFITLNAQDTFSRLLAGSITFLFFVSFFINVGMVSGIVPVAGVPLPLISYGGTAMVTMLANFGILMSIHTHRKLVAT